MRAAGCFLKGILVLLALPVGFALLVGIPLGALALLGFLADEAMAMLFVPAMAIYVFGFCLPVGVHQWWQRSHGHRSGPFRLPGAVWLAGAVPVFIGLGQIMVARQKADLGFWLVFILAAALPPLVALALASRRLGPITTWRRVYAGLLAGSLLSTHATILLGGSVTILGYLLVLPLRELIAQMLASRSLEGLFYSPALVVALVEVALVAPVVEELTKPLGAILLARRLRGPAEAFLVGMAGGVGFAILENMLYESAGPQWWASIATLRAIGGALHPLNAGLVAIGWYEVRNGLPGARGRLLGVYGLAVGLHALWNGGLEILYSGIGIHFLGTKSWEFNIYGVGEPGVVLTFMVLEAVLIWRLLFLATARLRAVDLTPEQPLVALRLERPRRLALWAMTALVLVVPVAALYGPLVERFLQVAMPIR